MSDFHRRSSLGAFLARGGVFVLGLMALTVWANLDAGSWSRARPVTWQAVLLIAASLVVGWLGWLLARRGPDESSESDRHVPTLRLRAGECLVVRYVSGGELGISVDDAERGAALLNTLVGQHSRN
ncbi:hypothetical protein [Haloactinomyces albus]|uniref:Membrane protein implicated in regulation of membrane protease activity n=1 Tax=Haloactinomyces albus TaxID=1352928 RepID=A0AAE4CLW5_9ACTN|nr:hypothetical protein [Haloactinomyces albus]MDR7301766.1 membrane protein implicated in regulation of membrane protease activity [Haloactinomyces albus]